MSRKSSVSLLLVMCLCCLPTFVFAWGNDGHQLICGLAESRLTENAKRFVDELLAQGMELDSGAGYQSFAKSCVWPDKVKYSTFRGSYESHFINLPNTSDSIDLRRDCAALDCILAAIQRNIVYLNSTAEGKREKSRKAAALRFLGHYVGDLHQPLHVSYKKDKGGNLIRVSWYGVKTNLHKIWDVHILEKSGISYPNSLDILRGDNFYESTIDVLFWANESYQLARNSAYVKANGMLIKNNEKLRKAYFTKSKSVVYQQLIKAGNRLALIINRIVEKKDDLRFMNLSGNHPLPSDP